MLSKDDIRTSKRISHALRHDPAKYGLTLDVQGFAPLEDVLVACRCSQDVLERIMAESSKPRFEVVDGLIRATHGHTIDVAAASPAAQPPALLYHGTTSNALNAIMHDGLSPMRRQYVHLHESRQVAWEAAQRFKGAGGAVMLVVDAAAAHQSGIEFHPAQGGVWLAKVVPAAYLQIEASRKDVQ